MNYDLLWSIEEYQSLIDYKWNSFKYINMFLNENITNRERNFKPNAKKAYPQSSEDFKKAIATIIVLYKTIQKNYILNDSIPYQQSLFRGVRKNSNHSYFTSTSENIEVALSFINGINNGDTSNDVLIEIEPSQVPWIDLERFIPASKGGDLEEKEILFLPCEYQTKQETTLTNYLEMTDLKEKLSKTAQVKISKLNNLICRKVKLIKPNYKATSYMSLDALAAKFQQYRENLIKLTEASKNGQNTTQIEKEIIEFKKYCSGFLKSKFNEIDIEFQKNLQNIQREHINIDKESTIKEVHIGNTGRMFSIQTFDGIEKYYFKPAESKNKESKPYRAYIQEAAYNIQRIINPTKAVKCNVCNINGTFGAIQEKIEIDKEKTQEMYKMFSRYGSEIPTNLVNQILEEYLVDYCLCNYDAHIHNFIIDKNGSLRGIDKEQSFKYIDKDINDDMLFSHNYNEEYGESETIYTTIFKKIVNGEISTEVLETLNYHAARLAQVPDDQYRQIFKNYAYSKTKYQQEAEMLLDRIVKRKKTIMKRIDILKEEISKERQKQINKTNYIEQTKNHKVHK